MLENLKVDVYPQRFSQRDRYNLSIRIINSFYPKKPRESEKPQRRGYQAHMRMVNTGIQILVSQWTPGGRFGPWIIGDDAVTHNRNQQLKQALDKIELVYQELKYKTGREPWATEIAQTFKDGFKQKPRKKIEELVKDYIDANNVTNENSVKGFKSFIACWHKFTSEKYNMVDMYANEITLDIIYRYEMYMAKAKTPIGKTYAQKTQERYFGALKTILAWAKKVGEIESNPGADHINSGFFKDGKENAPAPILAEANKWKLSPESLLKIETVSVEGYGVREEETEDGTKKRPNQYRYNLSRIRLLFLLQTWTGFAWGDLEKAKNIKDNIIMDLTGKKSLVYLREKNGQLAYLPLFPQTEKLLEALEYNATPKCSYDTYKRAVRQLMRYYAITDIDDKDATTHLGRHVFGSRMLTMGFPMESIARMMGHTSTKVTEKVYARPDIHSIHADYDRIKMMTQELGDKIAI